MTDAGLRSYRRYVRYQESDVAAAEKTVRSLLALPPRRRRYSRLITATCSVHCGRPATLRPPIALAGFDDFELAGLLALPLHRGRL